VASTSTKGVALAVGDLISYPKRGAHAEGTGLVGMIVFLGSWAMIFAAMFFVYASMRMKGKVEWPPADLPRLPVALGGFNTVLLAISSVALQLGLFAVRRARVRAMATLVTVSAVLGFAFLLLQLVSWEHLWDRGLTADTGAYASVFYALTITHGVHVLVGVLALAVLAVRAFRGVFSVPRHQPVRLWTIYWHFVGVVWVVMFVTVYLI
jgi:cytochrome c oxidase subunit III